MRKTLIFAATAVIAGVTITGCGGGKKVAANDTSANYKPVAGSPFGEVYEAPCAELDDDNYFTATGIASGSKNRMDVLQTSAITNAQNIVRQKMQHAYEGAIDDYSNTIGANAGTDMTAKVERGGTQIIMAIVNDTRAVCGPKFSSVDDKGDVTCFVGIRINKKEVASKIADHLSKDEVAGIRGDEAKFRAKMDERFKSYREDK
jgi:D-alanyl-D-alanine carboxypeptidase